MCGTGHAWQLVMSELKNHKDLDVWKKSVSLASEVYQITRSFPDEEKFGLVVQMRRAVVSIASNIAEGSARRSNKEFAQFLYVAAGSASELETQLLISCEVGIISHKVLDNISTSLDDISKMIYGLIRFLKKKSDEGIENVTKD